MAVANSCGFDLHQLQEALGHCTEAAALGERLHHQLEQLALGNAPETIQQLHNLVGRLSVCVARMACARDQLAGVIQVHQTKPRGEAAP